jgi:8-oxo-dGTP pyrophosphatase MutT (NUDIX family)
MRRSAFFQKSIRETPMNKRTRKPACKPKAVKPYTTMETVNGQKFETTYFEPTHPFAIEKVTGVKIIAFNDEGKILAVRKRKKFDPNRKLNIISGTHEGDDKNYEETIRREAREEANVTLGRLFLAAVIERKLKGASSTTYHLVMTARVKEFIPYTEYQEPNERFFLTREEFLKRYNAGTPEDMVKLIDMAEFMIEDAPECDPYIRQIMQHC